MVPGEASKPHLQDARTLRAARTAHGRNEQTPMGQSMLEAAASGRSQPGREGHKTSQVEPSA